MTDSPDVAADMPDDRSLPTVQEQLNYLRHRQKFMETAVCFLMGGPPTGRDVTWQDILKLKVIIDFAHSQVEAEEARKLQRAKRWSQLVRIILSLVGAIALWVFKELAIPSLEYLRNRPPIGWVGDGK
jgi:hypothetical protein